jgi:farnesyl diphosphate synthase
LALSHLTDVESALEMVATIVDRHLDTLLPADGSRIREAMRYAVLGQGKRLRPFLVVESAAVFGVKAMDCFRVGAALECVHSYSLVHDDLPAMDNDDLRRGRPTVHKAYNEATAILAGDALLTFAFEILSEHNTHPEAHIRAMLVLELARAAGSAGMVGGQMTDIEAESINFSSLEDISSMQRKKTGALFRFACEAPAIATDSDPTKIRQYADHIGLAFQITDDILDVESTAEMLGKATQKDKSKGKATFVDFLGLDGAKTEARRMSDAAIEALSGYDNSADKLRAIAAFVITRRK